MNSIEFKKTGNFWIDNGIVGLYKIIKDRVCKKVSCDNLEIILLKDKLIIKLLNNDSTFTNSILNLLNEAQNELSIAYVSTSVKNYRWYYDETKDKFYLFQKTSYKPHLRGTFFNAKPGYEGTLHLPNKLKEEVLNKIPKKKSMTEKQLKTFQSFKDENNEIFTKSIIAKEREEGFLNHPSKYSFGDNFNLSFFEKGNKICGFSGSANKDTIDINGMYSPFFTGTSGELNFGSFLSKKTQISSLYAFIALFAPFNLYYQLQNDLKNYFILYDSNLKELSNFYNAIQPDITHLKNADYCNFETYITGTQYESESFFNFLISVYKQAQPKMDKDKRRELFSKSVFTLSNDGNIFKDVKEYTSLVKLFDVFDAFSNQQEVNYFNDFLTLVRFFNKKIKPTEYDTSWRNRLCSNILSFRSVHKTIEWFLGEVKMKEETGNIYQLDKILEIYNQKTQPLMDKEMVSKCKHIGTTIGIYSQKEDDKSALFSLRNAKNRIEFLKVLSHIQFRIASSEKIEPEYKLRIYDDFFERLPNNQQWEEYKSLISIFAMNSFLYKKESKATTEQ